MTRDLLTKFCAVSFALAFWGGVAVWVMDNGLLTYPQKSQIASVLLLSIAFGSLWPIAAFDDEGFTTKPLNERIQIAVLVALLIGSATVLFVVELRTPVWVPMVLFAPITLAFVLPGFAFHSAERPDPVAGMPTDQEPTAPETFPNLQWGAGLAVLALMIWTVSQAHFYSRVDRGEIRFIAVVGLLWIPAIAKAVRWPLKPLYALIRRTGAALIFSCAAVLFVAISFFSLFEDVLPYALTKRFGTDTEYQAEVHRRKWYPNRLYCKGELVISARGGRPDFDRCFDHPSDYPGCEVGKQVQVTLRESFAGRYVSQMRVAK